MSSWRKQPPTVAEVQANKWWWWRREDHRGIIALDFVGNPPYHVATEHGDFVEELGGEWAPCIVPKDEADVDDQAAYPDGFLGALRDAIISLNLACNANENAVSMAGDLPQDVIDALKNLRTVVYPACPGCSEAGGAGLPVRHYPPLCEDSKGRRQ